MKSKKKVEPIEIKEHGNVYVEPDSVFVCPECGADSESGFEGESVEWRLSWHEKWVGEKLFYDVYADVYTCHCRNCGCKFEVKRRIHKDVKGEIIAGAISILVVVLIIMIVIAFGGETPPQPEP